MFNVRPVESNQTDCHPRLETVVQKHLKHDYQRPVHPLQHSIEKQLLPLISTAEAWVLDGGCGLGESSRHLAKLFPKQRILAVDKSLHRLKRGNRDSEVLSEQLWRQGQIYYLRADLVDLWQIAQRNNWHFHHCFLFYPNPWPKSEHLKRRWHGHAIFKALLDSCDNITLRSNWQIYCAEFEQALTLAGWRCMLRPLQVEAPISAFERKYHQAGQALYELNASSAAAE